MSVIKPARGMYEQYIQAVVSGEVAVNLNIDRAIHAWSNFDSVFLGLSGHMLGIKGNLTDFKSILQVFSSYEESSDLGEILFDFLFEAQQNCADSKERFEKEVEAQNAAWARLEPAQQNSVLDALSYGSDEPKDLLYKALYKRDLLRHLKSVCDTLTLRDSLLPVDGLGVNDVVLKEIVVAVGEFRFSMGNIPRV